MKLSIELQWNTAPTLPFYRGIPLDSFLHQMRLPLQGLQVELWHSWKSQGPLGGEKHLEAESQTKTSQWKTRETSGNFPRWTSDLHPHSSANGYMTCLYSSSLQGATYALTMEFTEDYPSKPPKCKFAHVLDSDLRHFQWKTKTWVHSLSIPSFRMQPVIFFVCVCCNFANWGAWQTPLPPKRVSFGDRLS